MGLIFGSGNFTRFIVDESLPEDYLETFPQKIARYCFRGLDESSDEERSTGWVNILDMFDSTFAGMEYFKDPCIALSWRVDVRNVPSKALMQYCREAEEKIKDMEGLEQLPKNRRREIKESVRIKLLKRAIPRSNTYDMIWNLQTGIVFFGGTSNKLCDEFAEFFLNTFALHLKTIYPYAIASWVLEGDEKDPELLDGLQYSIGMEDE